MSNSGGTAGNGVLYDGLCRGVIRRTTGARIQSWKGAAILRELEPRSRGIAIVRSQYPATTSEDSVGRKRLHTFSSDL
jgi:hypothetical protein